MSEPQLIVFVFHHHFDAFSGAQPQERRVGRSALRPVEGDYPLCCCCSARSRRHAAAAGDFCGGTAAVPAPDGGGAVGTAGWCVRALRAGYRRGAARRMGLRADRSRRSIRWRWSYRGRQRPACPRRMQPQQGRSLRCRFHHHILRGRDLGITQHQRLRRWRAYFPFTGAPGQLNNCKHEASERLNGDCQL